MANHSWHDCLAGPIKWSLASNILISIFEPFIVLYIYGKGKPILLKEKEIKDKIVTHSREYLETGIIYKTK